MHEVKALVEFDEQNEKKSEHKVKSRAARARSKGNKVGIPKRKVKESKEVEECLDE